jgi:superfamily II DNA/RNA helicase
LVIVNTRELCNQIFSVYEAMTKGSGITVSNFAEKDKKPAHVCVSIHGAFDTLLVGRKPLDLSGIKCIVVDEADIFFKEENFKYIWKVKDYKHVKEANPQWLLFSATYPDDNDLAGAEKMSKIVDEHAK